MADGLITTVAVILGLGFTFGLVARSLSRPRLPAAPARRASVWSPLPEPEAAALYDAAVYEAARHGHVSFDEIGMTRLALFDADVLAFLEDRGVDLLWLRRRIEERFQARAKSASIAELPREMLYGIVAGVEIQGLIQEADARAEEEGRRRYSIVDLVCAFAETEEVGPILRGAGFRADEPPDPEGGAATREGPAPVGAPYREQLPIRGTVVFWNDDETTMEAVVEVLEGFFGKTTGEAVYLMYLVHHKGSARVGVYPLDEAEALVKAATDELHGRGFPARLTIERASSRLPRG